jgi:hypothetical protein
MYVCTIAVYFFQQLIELSSCELPSLESPTEFCIATIPSTPIQVGLWRESNSIRS